MQFNHCVVLYHLHQYRAALTLLEKMYTGLESLGKLFSKTHYIVKYDNMGTVLCLYLIRSQLRVNCLLYG